MKSASSEMNAPLQVTGAGVQVASLGARTAVGQSAPSTAAAVRAGITRLREHSQFVAPTGDLLVTAHDADLPATLLGPDRLAALLLPAVQEAWQPFAQSESKTEVVRLFLALPLRRAGWTEADARSFEGKLKAQVGFGVEVQSFEKGHAGGALALAAGLAWLGTHPRNLCVVAAVDSPFQPDTVEALLGEKRLAFDGNKRSSYFPGEAAVCWVLGTDSGLKARRVTALGEVLSVCVAQEPSVQTPDAPNVGEGATALFRSVTAGLKLPQQKIGMTYCDFNGEPWRHQEFIYAALRCYEPFVDANRFEAPADCWGDVGAASALLLGLLPLQHARRGHVPHPYVLISTASVDGTRGGWVLRLPQGGG